MPIRSTTSTRTVTQKSTVYNFKVKGFHTYFVSNLGIWTHNACSLNPNKGGRFGDLDKVKGPNEVPHHIPQNAYNKTKGISRNNGPAVMMSKEDHAKTRTFAGRGNASMREAAAQGLNARQRVAKDIWDVKKLFGRKYNEGLRGAARYGQKLYKK